MKATKLITAYSKALFQSVQQVIIKEPQDQRELANLGTLLQGTGEKRQMNLSSVYMVGEELSLLRSLLVSSTKLKEFFLNPTYAAKNKVTLLYSVYPGLSKTTKSFLEILTERNHLFLLPSICEEFLEILLKFRKSVKVKLVVGSILQKKCGKLLLETLRKLTNAKTVILNLTYSPKLLGGFLLEYNSTLIDASILNEFSLFFTES